LLWYGLTMAVHRKIAPLRTKPLMQSAEALDRFTRERVREELAAAVKRKGPSEGRIAGLVRTLATHSAMVQKDGEGALRELTDRARFERPLFHALLLQSAAAASVFTSDIVRSALTENSPPNSAFAASALLPCENLRSPLQTLASSTSSSLAFAAEMARACRGEAGGQRLAALAARLKESARLEFIDQVLYPLSFLARLPTALVTALRVLRKSERNLGRWMFLARAGMLATDGAALVEARERASSGVVSGRSAWACVAWALDASAQLPAKLSTDILARLCDRGESSFLFELGMRAHKVAESHLRQLAADTTGAQSVRAQHVLASAYKDSNARRALLSTATRGSEETKGLALACAWDAQIDSEERDRLRDLAGSHATSRNLATMGWASLVRLACDHGLPGPLVTERRVRWLHAGDAL
jgi:hypothetical protein